MQNQDSSALSVSGRLTSHDLSCLSVSGGLPECSEVTIYRACQCLEASQGANLHKVVLRGGKRHFVSSARFCARRLGFARVWLNHAFPEVGAVFSRALC